MTDDPRPLLVAFSAGPELAKRIEEEAARSGLSVAEYVKRVVRCGIDLYNPNTIKQFNEQ
ncbi:hypothetical protein [Methylobacterium nonmethylotrophicum]|uniref:Ribbon-helix-helix protein CopG domain-containing protein n=1 Tax=Methylobacterium nonmethylotrophicum TaxID=1141884 RepID=A0A4Z0NWX0_9HYPH|nr:hypothetical protein [Methylobacterium nonmethylotrophicum]TGE01970.1 hypothetical protein EU555_04710 [Methylobacterium nonmethylotrophicum]